MEIDLDNRSGQDLDLEHWCGVMATFMQAMELGDDTGVSISFVDDAEMQALNKQYRGYDKPTDVLSFSNEEGEAVVIAPGVPRYLGDIVISLPTTARQAAEAGHAVEHELAVLLAHGLLHLLGYDHAEEDEAKAMFARQDALVALLAR